MIINGLDAEKRLNSPTNLINRLKSETSPRKSAMSLFIKPQSPAAPSNFNPFVPQTPESIKTVGKELESTKETPAKLSDILENADAQINLGLAHDNAIKLLNNSITQLTTKLDDVSAKNLPSVINAAAKTIEGIRKERNEASKNNKDREVHYHFYTPEQKKVSEYKIIDVTQ